MKQVTMEKHYKKRKVLVTGTTGFIGSHLCEQLLANGDQSV